MTVPNPPEIPGLRDELVAAGLRHQDKRRRQRRVRRRAASITVVFAITVTAVVGISLGTASTPDTAAEVRVIDRGDVIDVTLTDLNSRAADVEAALDKAGLDVEVNAVPVAPSAVGLFATISSDAPLPPELRDRSGGKGFAGFSIPKNWDGHLVVNLGRAARDGENWEGNGNALAPRESLACVDLLGLTATDAKAIIAPRGLAIRWLTISPAGSGEVADDELTDSPEAGWRVFGVESASPGEVWVSLSEDGESPFLLPTTTLPPGACAGVAGP